MAAGKPAHGWDRVHKGDLIALQFRIDAKPCNDGAVDSPRVDRNLRQLGSGLSNNVRKGISSWVRTTVPQSARS